MTINNSVEPAGCDDDLAPPGPAAVGEQRRWVLPLDDFTNGETLEFEGRFLGFGSSEKPGHINHEAGEYVRRGKACSACRWFESRIFRAHGDKRYLLFTVGASIVPGEEPRYKAEWLTTPYEIIDSLTTYKINENTQQRDSWLSTAARKVLAQAAWNDREIRVAYEGRLTQL